MGMTDPWFDKDKSGMNDPGWDSTNGIMLDNNTPTMEEVFQAAYPPPEEYHHKPTLVDKAAKIGGLIALWQVLFGKK